MRCQHRSGSLTGGRREELEGLKLEATGGGNTDTVEVCSQRLRAQIHTTLYMGCILIWTMNAQVDWPFGMQIMQILKLGGLYTNGDEITSQIYQQYKYPFTLISAVFFQYSFFFILI